MTQVQVLLGLCLACVAAAAPQLGSRRTVTTTSREVSSNSDQIVTSVISALQQPIASAVAEALRGLQTTRTVTTTGGTSGFGNTNSGFTSSGISLSKGSFSSANTGLSLASGFGTENNGFSSSKGGFASSKSSSGFRGATSGLGVASGLSSNSGVSSQSSAPVDLGPYVKPEYNFEFKVSDDSAQTYISREEARDGTELTGSYKFVDPTGALVTVNYNAGVGGYEETREVQDGAVQMSAQPVVSYESSYESSAAADLAASQYAAAQRLAAEQAAAQRLATEQAAARRASAEQAAAQRVAQQKSAAAFRAQQAAIKRASDKRIAAEKAAAQRVSSTKTSTSNSNALIANIIATLQPQIGAAVQSAIGTSGSVSSRRPVVQTSSIRAVSAPAVRASSQTISSGQTSSLSSSSGQVSGISSSSGQTSSLSSSSGQASSLSSLFGNGGNLVRIATPKFQVEY